MTKEEADAEIAAMEAELNSAKEGLDEASKLVRAAVDEAVRVNQRHTRLALLLICRALEILVGSDK